MERRWTTRTDAALSVDLYSQSGEVLDCTTRDISFGGVFLKMRQALPEIGTLVELIFKFEAAEDEPSQYKMPARIVRTVNGGAGIMFRDFDATAFRSLREVLRHKEGA